MNPLLALLPLDDRPVNYDYPRYLARIAGYELQLPPREWLGNPWRTSQHSHLVDWLVYEAAHADVLVVALDTLAYGGLIPSRTSNELLESVLERLACLKEVKSHQPNLPIYASSVILRISRDDSSEEEKDYWATYGSRMFRLSYLEHKLALCLATADERVEKENLAKEIPREVYDDYLAGRKRNHLVNQAMIDWLEQGVFSYLLLPQDDTAEYGWNIAEAHNLQATIRQKHLTGSAITYPGADEIGCLLLASAACHQAGFKPKVFPRYSSIHSPMITTSYEDRPIHELIKAHLSPLNGVLAASPEEADLLLYLNAPAHCQGEASLQWVHWKGLDSNQADTPASLQPYLSRMMSDSKYQHTRDEMDSPERNPEEFVRAMFVELGRKRPVALADVAFANGSDMALGNLLEHNNESVKLSAYSGWNTAGNTLGTTLSHAVLRLLAKRDASDPEQTRAHYEFLFLRILDDYYYQTRIRSQLLLEDLPSLNLQPTMERLPSSHVNKVEESVCQRLAQSARQLEKLFMDAGVVKSVQVSNIHLPWQRLFEVGFDVRAEL
jgi:hypothetical protein